MEKISPHHPKRTSSCPLNLMYVGEPHGGRASHQNCHEFDPFNSRVENTARWALAPCLISFLAEVFLSIAPLHGFLH